MLTRSAEFVAKVTVGESLRGSMKVDKRPILTRLATGLSVAHRFSDILSEGARHVRHCWRA